MPPRRSPGPGKVLQPPSILHSRYVPLMLPPPVNASGQPAYAALPSWMHPDETLNDSAVSREVLGHCPCYPGETSQFNPACVAVALPESVPELFTETRPRKMHGECSGAAYEPAARMPVCHDCSSAVGWGAPEEVIP